MPGVTREQIDRAKEWDLLSYLQTYEPGELTKKRPTDKEYRTKTHDSLVISNGRWNWTTRGFGGKTALDYLIKVRGMEFVEAVRTLNDGRAAPSLSQPVTRPPEQPRAFALPEGNRCATAAVSYLQRRGIDSEIISRCIRAGIFFESRKYHNCVFVGRTADYVLRDYKNVINIFITANIDDRIKAVCKRKDIDRASARKFIESHEEQRASYYDYYTGKKWGHSESYDLCINSSHLGIEETEKFIAEFIRKKFGLSD